MTKHAGCGLNPAGVAATQPGECAVECPVCPHPGKNLPEDWETADEDLQYVRELLHSFLYLNFCLGVYVH